MTPIEPIVSDSTLRFPKTTLLSDISAIIDDDFCVVVDNELFVVVEGEEALISKDGLIVVEVVVLEVVLVFVDDCGDTFL
jgi:hypothetical protein